MKLLNRLDKAVALFLVTALLLSSFTFTTFAMDSASGTDSSTGGTTTTNTTTKTSITTTDLTGGLTFTDLTTNSVANDVTESGVYISEDTGYIYMIFTDKKTSSNTYYRTVGFTVHMAAGNTTSNAAYLPIYPISTSTSSQFPYPSSYTGSKITAYDESTYTLDYIENAGPARKEYVGKPTRSPAQGKPDGKLEITHKNFARNFKKYS